MSIEALWAVKFAGVYGGMAVARSAGIVILESGRIFGGDSWTYYTGNYERNPNGTYKVSIQTGVYNREGGQDIFGAALQPRKFEGEVQLSADQRSMSANLTVEGAPQMKVTATLTWVAPLP